ncbi:AraC family transcriptional regulator [Paenibacillus yonginensis]|uniref:AraC family transcriptional regulator n=1 Tax=Paenibacillus yonginensis TaxID=1462996 RepID=A0A1B1N6R6_9BACL|nr:helix-turn-helix domain-containing protein [Paenibacillus yonginensis]ANS77126.1 AraC family transcriptional regulator [Paenibacillus yonginensis]
MLERTRQVLRQSHLFRRFLISYLIILIIPSFAGYLSYRTSISLTESMSIENSVTELNKSKEMLERRMAEVEGFTRQLALNQDLNALLNEKPAVSGEMNVFGIWQLLKQVTPFSQTNDFLQNYYIYLSNYNVILAKGSTYRPESYYQSSHYENMSLTEWEDQVLHGTHRSEITPLNTLVTEDKQISAISYMQSLPLDSFSGSSPAAIVVTIDEQNIQNLLSGWIERYGGWTSITDKQGQPLSLQGISTDKMKAISSELESDKGGISRFVDDDLVITIPSKVTGWVYRAGIPKEILMQNANHIKHISWMFTGAALLVGLLVGLFLSYRHTAPLNRLLAMFKEQVLKEDQPPKKRNEFDFLHGNISQILVANRQLETVVARQFPLVRDGFLKRLINGEFETKSEILAAAMQAQTELESHSGYVGILQVNGYPDLDSVDILNELYAARLLVKQMLSGSETASGMYLTDLGSDRIVMIVLNGMNGEEADGEKLRLQLESLIGKVIETGYQEYKMKLTASFGAFFSSLQEISQSFEQAKQTAEYAAAEDSPDIVWFSDSRLESGSYYYPLDMEQRLISTVRAGDREEAEKLLRSVLEQNRDNRNLLLEMRHQFINEIKATLIKLLDQKVFLESERQQELHLKIMGIQAGIEWDGAQREFGEIIAGLSEIVTSKQNDSQRQIVEKIKQFISQHYSDGELNLYRIAEQAGRPEKYISQLFKEITGTNLSDYLERVRMEEAVKLLQGKQYTVDEISEMVGYNSAHSFRRAFKRVRGVSPSAYRQLAQ